MRVHHLALRVADVERSVAFYAGLLGLVERRRLPAEDGSLRSVWLEADGVLLMLEGRLRGAGADEGSAHLLAFAVDDLRAWEARLRAAGIAVDDRTAHSLYLHDPDGHRVGLTVYRSDP